jgi:hypothetical protein
MGKVCYMGFLFMYVVHTTRAQSPTPPDWLLGSTPHKAQIYTDAARKEVVLTNGLVSRSFRVAVNVSGAGGAAGAAGAGDAANTACVDYVNEVTGEQLLRAVGPEARVVLNGRTFNVGGLYGQREKAYLQASRIDSLTAHPDDFQCTGWSQGPLKPFLHWVSHTWTGNRHQPSGIALVFTYKYPATAPIDKDLASEGSNAAPEGSDTALAGIKIMVHYALYDDLPLLCKWVTIDNDGGAPVRVDRVVNEVLATPEEQSAVVGSTEQMARPHGLYIESDYAFNNSMRYDLSDQTTHWMADSSYTSQVNYNYQTPCLLETYPAIGPGVTLNRGDSLRSIRTFELLMDSYDRERRGLEIRRMYRTVAPWTTQNPIFMHLVSKSDDQVYTAIDQCVATGYEAVILSFGSHCDLEDSSAENIRRWKAIAGYAHRKGILIGGYSLFSSRHISDSDDVISPKTGKPGGAFFGYAPCYGSDWGLAYLAKIKYFLSRTGFDILENDGPYAGDVCAATSHPGHKGLEDSQWEQMLLQKSLYHWCNERGIYVNAPDWYFLDGTNKIALGYREVNFSLPRDQQMILNRQNIYDGTWEKTPSMGWGFVPLTRYQGGGPEAVLEPLKDHLRDYKQLMIQYYGSGVQACYRGPRLYDTDSTRELVAKTIGWYKRYRDILNGDIIHLRRPDGRDWDGILHVDPKGGVKGFLLLYNPLDVSLTRTITVPLHYTGLSGQARVSASGGQARVFYPDREDNIRLKVVLPPAGYAWYTIE